MPMITIALLRLRELIPRCRSHYQEYALEVPEVSARGLQMDG